MNTESYQTFIKHKLNENIVVLSLYKSLLLFFPIRVYLCQSIPNIHSNIVKKNSTSREKFICLNKRIFWIFLIKRFILFPKLTFMNLKEHWKCEIMITNFPT